VDDPRGPELHALAVAGGADPRPLLADKATFGSLGTRPDFVAAVRQDLADLEAEGIRAVLTARLAWDEQLLSA
jgi:fructuronate reductase/mannitol 2-dehydrogenase